MDEMLSSDRNLKEISSAVVRYAVTCFVLFTEPLMVRSLGSERVLYFGTPGRCSWFVPTFSL